MIQIQPATQVSVATSQAPASDSMQEPAHPDTAPVVAAADPLARFVADFGLHPAALQGADATASESDQAPADEDPLMNEAQSLKAANTEREREATDSDAGHKSSLPNFFQW